MAARQLFRTILREPTGLVPAAIAFLPALAVVTWLSGPLGWPSHALAKLIPVGDCVAYTPGTAAMYRCSFMVALRTTIAPAIIVAVVVIGLMLAARFGRRRLRAMLQRIPAEVGWLAVPLLAGLLFTIVWAGLHSDPSAPAGIVSQRLFPALLAPIVVLALRHRETIAARGARLGTRAARSVIALLVALPLGVAAAITAQERVTRPVLKEQVVAILTILCAATLLALVAGRRRIPAATE